ncbi:hypothetical protein JCM3774_001207 [Rhodotorula dairenensis]
MAPVYRVILVRYKSDVDAAAKERIARGYLALAQQCTHERDGKPYFTVVGGTNNSQEGLSGAMEQAFVVTFRSTQDRDYFIHHDLVRAKYRDQIMPSFEELRVADFEENVFE